MRGFYDIDYSPIATAKIKSMVMGISKKDGLRPLLFILKKGRRVIWGSG
jgi:hypothetical protein